MLHFFQFPFPDKYIFFRENAGVQYFVKSLEFYLIQDHYWANTFKKINSLKKVIRKHPDRKVKRKRTNMEDTDVKIPIETWMQSQHASGFPKIIGKILDQLDLDSLINCRQVSMTFKNFLDKKYGSDFWMENLGQVIKEYRLAIPDKRNQCLSWAMFLKMVRKRGSIDNIIEFKKLIKQSEEQGNLKFPSDFFEMVDFEERKQ